MRPLLYALPENEAFTRALAAAWPGDVAGLEVHRFPDGESRVHLASLPRGRDVVLVCTLHDPDPRLLPLLFAAGAARELGARSVGLVAPYLAYMRQDQRFREGEAVSARQFARLLSAQFDWLATVDPHLHRVHALAEIFTIPAVTVPAAPLLARWIAAHVERPLLVGPDSESRQWVARVAEQASAPWVILDKERRGDRQVVLRVPDVGRWAQHTPVLVDDIISSGGTLVEATRALCGQGLRAPVCAAVHAVFAPWAYWALLEAGVARIITTDTIAHATNGVPVAPAIAAACHGWCRPRLRCAPRREPSGPDAGARRPGIPSAGLARIRIPCPVTSGRWRPRPPGRPLDRPGARAVRGGGRSAPSLGALPLPEAPPGHPPGARQLPDLRGCAAVDGARARAEGRARR